MKYTRVEPILRGFRTQVNGARTWLHCCYGLGGGGNSADQVTQ